MKSLERELFDSIKLVRSIDSSMEESSSVELSIKSKLFSKIIFLLEYLSSNFLPQEGQK